MKDLESSFESRPDSSYDSESTESITKNRTDHAVFVFDDDQSRTESVSRKGRLKRNRRQDVSDQTSTEEDQGASWPPDIEDVRAKMVRWLWIAIGIITAIVAAVILWFAL